jgi:GTP-binding protein HflX
MDGKEYFIVFNKKDLLTDPLQAKIALNKYPNSFMVSSFDKEEMVNLRHAIINYFLEKQDHYDLFIPYDQGQFHSVVLSQTNVLNQENHQDGIFYRVRIPQFIFDKLGLSQFITAPKGGPASEAALLKSTASKINNDSKIDDGD